MVRQFSLLKNQQDFAEGSKRMRHNIPRKTSLSVLAKPQVSKSTRLLDQLPEQIRYLHYSLRTEEASVYWVKNFIHFHHLKLDFYRRDRVITSSIHATWTKPRLRRFCLLWQPGARCPLLPIAKP